MPECGMRNANAECGMRNAECRECPNELVFPNIISIGDPRSEIQFRSSEFGVRSCFVDCPGIIVSIALQKIQPRTWLLLQEKFILSGIKIRRHGGTLFGVYCFSPKFPLFATDKAPTICLMCVSFDTGINWFFVITIYYLGTSMMGTGLFRIIVAVYDYWVV